MTTARLATSTPPRSRLGLRKPARAARLFATVLRAIQGLQLWASRLTPPPFRLVQIGSAYWQSRALGVATELDVASQLGDDTLAIGVLAQRCNVVPDGLQRVLRLLAALGVFEEAQPGHWRNNRGSAPLRADRPSSVRDLVLLHQRPEMRAPWNDTLASALRLGRPAFEVLHGQPLFEHMATDPALEEAFAKAMAQVEGLTGTPWVDAIDWRAFHRLLDVGGSAGDKALTLLARHAHLHALVIDRPATVAAARFLRASETDPQRSAACARLSFHAADVRQDALPPASSAKDVFWLSALLHGMSDADALQVLQRVARAAAPVGATVLVMEAVRNEETADLAVSGMDLQMAVCTEGRERSLREWEGLFAQARLQLRERVPLPMLAEIMVLNPL